jgi:hypothetical protein
MEVIPILEHIEQIGLKTRNCKLSAEILRSLKPRIREVAKFIGCEERQAVFFSLIFMMNFRKSDIELDEIAGYLGCNIMTLVKHLPDFESLITQGLIRKDQSGRRKRRCPDRLDSLSFYIPVEIIRSLTDGERPTLKKEKEPLNLYTFLNEVEALAEQRDNMLISLSELYDEINALINYNLDLPIVKQVKQFELSNENLIIFLYSCSQFIDYDSEVELTPLLKGIFPDLQDQLKIRRQFLEYNNELQKKGLIKLEEGQFRGDRSIQLTEYALSVFFENEKDLFEKKSKKRVDLIKSSEIFEKKLFFDREETEQIEFIIKALQPENFNKLQQRLKIKGRNTGVGILLHGNPGTGKTSAAYEIARRTGRDIKMVVISEAKSAYYSESEKRIKAIFTEYDQLVRDFPNNFPIILFNEADSLFSTRRELSSVNTGVGQTENSIQNVLLQELENLTGILLATSNMTANFDKAFERRFLYKIKFNPTSLEAKIQIWKNLIPELTHELACSLANEYPLSASQIDNVATKYLTIQLLTGSNPGYNEIEKLCAEEFLERKERVKIGFVK